MADDTTSNESVSENAPTTPEPAAPAANLDDTDPGEPTAAAPAPAAPPARTEPVDRVVREPASSGRRGVVAVPVWLAALVAIFIVGGLGFAVGWFAAPGDSDVRSISSSSSDSSPVPRTLPNLPGLPRNNNGNQAFLGVAAENSTNPRGARIDRVLSGGPADDAGLRDGDVITAVGNSDVRSAADLAGRIESHRRGDQVEIKFDRNGDSKTAEVRLESRDSLNSANGPSTRS